MTSGWRVGISGIVFVVVSVLAYEAQPEPVRQTPWEWQRDEVARYLEGVREVQLRGWEGLNTKVNAVIAQLVRFSNMSFRVVPAQTFNIGQAHLGGWILLDISTAQRPKDELAFWLAHEWGHEALGHQPNYYHPMGQPWRVRYTETADEDAADFFAGRFICAAGYDIDKVVKSVRRMPKAHGDRAHSDGPQRAKTALAGYKQQGCGDSLRDEDEGDSHQRPRCRSQRVSCTHPAHPVGDQSPCSHPLHPRGDMVPCSHPCPGMYGAVPCHQFDVIPCSHPSHMFDVSPCTHAEHPGGDLVQQCD